MYYRPKSDFKVVGYDEILPYVQEAEPGLRVILSLGWLTGARISELLMLRKKDVREEGQDVRIILHTLKQRKHRLRELVFSREDPFISNVIIPYVQVLPDPESMLFSLGVRAYQVQLNKLNQKLHGDPGPRWLTFHYLRHGVITYLTRELRASDNEVRQWTGHSTKAFEEYIIAAAPERFKGRFMR